MPQYWPRSRVGVRVQVQVKVGGPPAGLTPPSHWHAVCLPLAANGRGAVGGPSAPAPTGSALVGNHVSRVVAAVFTAGVVGREVALLPGPCGYAHVAAAAYLCSTVNICGAFWGGVALAVGNGRPRFRVTLVDDHLIPDAVAGLVSPVEILILGTQATLVGQLCNTKKRNDRGEYRSCLALLTPLILRIQTSCFANKIPFADTAP